MRQYDILLVNGCSHTFGAETIIDGDTNNPENPNHSWAAHLGQILGVKRVDNLAVNGNSNDNIYHELVHHTLTKIPPHLNTLCIVQWTKWNRVVYINPENVEEQSLLNPYEITKPHINKQVRESYVNHLSRDPKTVLTWMINQHTLNGFFRLRNIDFCFFHIEPFPLGGLPKRYHVDIDHMTNLMPWGSLWTNHMDQYAPCQKYGHYPESAHKQWAQDIYTVLKHRYQEHHA